MVDLSCDLAAAAQSRVFKLHHQIFMGANLCRTGTQSTTIIMVFLKSYIFFFKGRHLKCYSKLLEMASNNSIPKNFDKSGIKLTDAR